MIADWDPHMGEVARDRGEVVDPCGPAPPAGVSSFEFRIEGFGLRVSV